MAKKTSLVRVSKTPATQWLDGQGATYTEHTYDYVEHGGAAEGAAQLGVPLHSVIKTLVMQDQAGQPLIMLMYGDCQVSSRNLARQIGCKSVQPCEPAVAERHSGYQVGGTSPFGLRKQMPVYVETGIFELPLIYINGGRRGYLLGMPPEPLHTLLAASRVVTLPDRPAQ